MGKWDGDRGFIAQGQSVRIRASLCLCLREVRSLEKRRVMCPGHLRDSHQPDPCTELPRGLRAKGRSLEVPSFALFLEPTYCCLQGAEAAGESVGAEAGRPKLDPSSLLSGCVALGSPPHLSEPPFPT